MLEDQAAVAFGAGRQIIELGLGRFHPQFGLRAANDRNRHSRAPIGVVCARTPEGASLFGLPLSMALVGIATLLALGWVAILWVEMTALLVPACG